MTRVPVKLVTSALVPTGAAAWVPLPRVIYVRPGVQPTTRLIAHELRHVIQAEQNPPWPLTYVWQWARSGFSYTHMPFEVEARAAESERWYLDWAADLLFRSA